MRPSLFLALLLTLGLACAGPVDSSQPAAPEAVSSATPDASVAATADSDASSPSATTTGAASLADTDTRGPGALGGSADPSPDSAVPAQPGPDNGSAGGGTIGGPTPSPPPGCNDVRPSYGGWIVDDQTFVLSNAVQPCGAPASAATREHPDYCPFSLSYITYRVPTLWFAGTYEVGGAASATIERQLPSDFDRVAGCRCLPSIDTPKPIDSGVIKVTPNNVGGIDVEVPLGLGWNMSSRLSRCPKR